MSRQISFLQCSVLTLVLACSYFLVSAEVDTTSEEIKRIITEKCGAVEAEELRKHCTLRELKKIEIKDAIMAHLGDADLSSSGAGEVNQRLVQDLLAKHQVQDDAAEVPSKCPNGDCERDSITNSIVVRATTGPANLPEDEHRIWFDTQELGRREFDHAVVLFHVGKVKQLHPGRKFKVHFYKYASDSDVSVSSVDEVNPDDVTDWGHVHVSALLRHWQQEPKENYGIQLKITVDDASGERIYSESVALSDKPTFLEISSARTSVKLHKRSLSERPRDSEVCEVGSSAKNKSCCVYPLEISFDEFGWNWIVAPKKMKFYYCAGACKAQDRKHNTHSKMISLDSLNNMCCSADKIDPLQILFQDTDCK
ncbi:hypothetical protein AAVH_00919 [Aphelenchoides avenae]|nr:hypothetical protein AAVH_00919 [Aphelenchus avenae]